MKENQIQKNTEFYKICSICNKSILDINLYCIPNSFQKQKLKENLKYIQPSQLIKKCNCKNINKDINNNNDLYSHKYCILLNIIYNFEIKCEKCNTIYNIKIIKKINSKRKFYFYFIFLFLYIIHLSLYILCIFVLFIRTYLKKELIKKKYNHLPYFFVIILFIINSIFLFFTIINNIGQRKYIYSYTIDIYNINDFNITNKYYELIYDFYIWFYEKSKTSLLIDKIKNYIINKGIYNFKKELREYIKENNNQCKNIIKIENKISNEKLNINNFLKIKNNSKNENDNLLDNIKFNKNSEIKIENNNSNLMDELYSDRTDKNNNEVNINNDDLNIKKNIIDMTSINKFNKDKINININPIQANNINININFNHDLNNNLKSISNNEHNEFYFFPSNYLHGSNGKTAFVLNKKNFMNKLIDDNTFKNYIKKRRQIKSIKLKQKDIKLKNKKIIGNIEENEEIDFSDFEKGKMDSRISKEIKLYYLKNSGSANDLFKTKKSYKDVALNISNPTDSNICEDLANNRFSLKNNIVVKNANFSNSNLFHYKKK